MPWVRQFRAAVMFCGITLFCMSALAALPIAERIAALRELNRFVPQRTLGQLLELSEEARTGPDAIRVDFLSALSLAYLNSGNKQKAHQIAGELLELTKDFNASALRCRALMTMASVMDRMNESARAHQLIREAEALSSDSGASAELKVDTALMSAQAYLDEGNFPAALMRLLGAVDLAKSRKLRAQSVYALHALADLYNMTKEFDKGFAAVEAAWVIAKEDNSLPRMAILKITEHSLSLDTGQIERGLKALLEALDLARRVGSKELIALACANLSETYLMLDDSERAISYARQGLRVARELGDSRLEAAALVNLGQADVHQGRIQEGKKNFELAFQFMDKYNDKPQLQATLVDYGDALERSGDLAGALQAYHRERELSEELFAKERTAAFRALQQRYEAQHKQSQIDLLTRENRMKSAEIDHHAMQQALWWTIAGITLIGIISVGLLHRKVRRAYAALKVKNLELKHQSSRDPLTLLYNRRHFHDFMESFPSVEKRGALPVDEELVGVLFLLDVDHFKSVNDKYGHAAGDVVLKMVAENLRIILRETDMIVRWGGEEFLAFVPSIPRSGVEEIARRILAGIGEHVVEHHDTRISVNVSIGYAHFPLIPGHGGMPWERAVNLVDMALYLAKANGRNRAYGVRGFANLDLTTLEDIERDLERAARAGFVDLSIVLGA